MDASAFEGLFVRALQPRGPFADALRAAGFDPEAPLLPRYPARAWRECVEVARHFTFPELAPEAGLRALGARFLGGFLETLTGRLIGGTLPRVGPAGLMKVLPRYLLMARAGVDVHATREDACAWRLEARDPHGLPDFLAGYLEAGLGRAGAAGGRVAVLERRPEGFTLRVAWDPPPPAACA